MPPWVKIGLIALQGLQVAFLLLHDWIPLGRLNNLRAVRVSDPPRKLLMVTLLSAFPFALVFGASYAYWDSPRWPMWLQTWLWCTCGIFGHHLGLVGPYLLWRSPERAHRYQLRFAGTLRFLPERNGIAPDALHTCYHLCVVGTLILLAVL